MTVTISQKGSIYQVLGMTGHGSLTWMIHHHFGYSWVDVWWCLQNLFCKLTYLTSSAVELLPKVRLWFQHVDTELVRSYSDKIFFQQLLVYLDVWKNLWCTTKHFPINLLNMWYLFKRKFQIQVLVWLLTSQLFCREYFSNIICWMQSEKYLKS